MEYLKSFVSILKRNSLARSIAGKIVPIRVRTNLFEYLNGGSISLYFENNISFIKTKDARRLKGCMPVFYWDGQPNFGDVVGPYLISKITGKPVLNIKKLQEPGIMAVGSIIQMLDRKNMVIWGSGLMNKLTDERTESLKKYNPKILSVRGLETARNLLEAGLDVPDQRFYGDPALILPLFYRPSVSGPKKIGICPHFVHKPHFLKYITDQDSLKVIDVQKDMESVVDAIYSSSVCISSSLHGLIIAQAYNIPWVWLEIFDSNIGGGEGSDFKFKDFFSTLNESQVSHVRVRMQDIKNINYKEIAEMATLPDKMYSEKLILESLKSYLEMEDS